MALWKIKQIPSLKKKGLISRFFICLIFAFVQLSEIKIEEKNISFRISSYFVIAAYLIYIISLAGGTNLLRSNGLKDLGVYSTIFLLFLHCFPFLFFFIPSYFLVFHLASSCLGLLRGTFDCCSALQQTSVLGSDSMCSSCIT